LRVWQRHSGRRGKATKTESNFSGHPTLAYSKIETWFR
jgi:hypothetical protein